MPMKLARLLPIAVPLMFWSCAAPNQARLTTFNIGAYENNWDQILISQIDGQTIMPPKDAVAVRAGKRTVSFSLSYMRGDLARPILAEVPVTANFMPDHVYRASVHYETGFMGVLIAERRDPPKEDTLAAGAMVYSPEFDAYGQKSKRRHKADR